MLDIKMCLKNGLDDLTALKGVIFKNNMLEAFPVESHGAHKLMTRFFFVCYSQ